MYGAAVAPFKTTTGKNVEPLVNSENDKLMVESDVKNIDPTTNAVIIQDYPHSEIHGGSHYFYMSHHDMPKNTVNDHIIITPDTEKWAHMIFSYNSTGGQVHVEFTELPTFSSIGTLEQSKNRNRNYTDSSTTLIYENPTITAQGNELFSQKLGADDKKLSIGGDSRGSNEIVLRQNTAYLFRVTELNIDPTIINIEFDWYEHQNRA